MEMREAGPRKPWTERLSLRNSAPQEVEHPFRHENSLAISMAASDRVTRPKNWHGRGKRKGDSNVVVDDTPSYGREIPGG
jgi:hypothetical protein